MNAQELLGLIMLLVMLGAIFIGIPISFTLLFLALIFGVSANHRHDEAGRICGRADVYFDGLHL
jgi:TRAP-type mannitol/chloroaromatic compound transport system permease large subunit